MSLPPRAREAYWKALSDSDRRAAVRVALDCVAAGVPPSEVLADLVCGAQREVGRRWATNEWNIAREHAATSISEEVVAALAVRDESPGGRGIALISCVEGEWHSLPARVLAQTLREGGWDVHYLGASLPAAHLAQCLHDVGPDVTALSCSVSTSLPRARTMIEASRGAGVPVIAGGRGFGADGRWARVLGADGWAATAPQARDLLASPAWPRYTTPAPVLTHPDGAATDIRRRLPQLVDEAEARLLPEYPSAGGYTADQRERTREDLGHILRFLAAALFVDDPTLFEDFAAWTRAVLQARGVPGTALVGGLRAVATVLGDHPRAGHFVDVALEALSASEAAAG